MEVWVARVSTALITQANREIFGSLPLNNRSITSYRTLYEYSTVSIFQDA